MKKKFVKIIASVMTKELQISAKTTGSGLAYQPKVPDGIKKFKKC